MIAIAAIGVSVLMHVAWNLMARHVDQRANFLWWGLLAHLVLFGPVGIYGLVRYGQWQWPLILAIVVTALANSLYFLSLRRVYHYAPPRWL